ncbi:MAG: hypothetical protein WAM70_02235, partial [Pyrinomonadaceae bacterium]
RAKVGNALGDRLTLTLAKGHITTPSLSGATFEDESIEANSLTITFPGGGSCSLEASEISVVDTTE